jgi:hypothetical protein
MHPTWVTHELHTPKIPAETGVNVAVLWSGEPLTSTRRRPPAHDRANARGGATPAWQPIAGRRPTSRLRGATSGGSGSRARHAKLAGLRPRIAIRHRIAWMHAVRFNWIRVGHRAVMWTRACHPPIPKEPA